MTAALADLEVLTQMVLDRDLARLKELAQCVSECRSAVTEIAQARSERAGALAGSDVSEDLAGLMGRDLVWRDWLREEHSRRQAKLARALADFEAQRIMASEAFGRAEALRHLREAEVAERRLAMTRRRPDQDNMG